MSATTRTLTVAADSIDLLLDQLVLRFKPLQYEILKFSAAIGVFRTACGENTQAKRCI
jgi:hypothetical protein